MSLEGAIAQIQIIVGAIPGIQSAPSKVPDSAGAFPFAVSYPRSGGLVMNSVDWANVLHTIYTELHFGNQLLAISIPQAMPYARLVFLGLMADITLAGNVSEISAVRYTFGKLAWAGIETIGFRFEIDVKEGIQR